MNEWQAAIDSDIDGRPNAGSRCAGTCTPIPSRAARSIRTTEYLAQQLGEAGLRVRIAPTGRGLVAEPEGLGDRPRVAIRADIDALRIADAKSVPYRSCRDGLMHACGHDAHATMALGRRAGAVGVPRGSSRTPIAWRAIFQPAEEVSEGADRDGRGGRGRGCPRDRGAARRSGAERRPDRPAHRACLTAACQEVRIVDPGRRRACGPARTWPSTRSPSPPSSCSSLYQLVPRSVDARDPSVVTFGSIRGGTSPNIIPDEVELLGTIRTLSDRAAAQVEERITQVARGLSAASRCDDRRRVPPGHRGRLQRSRSHRGLRPGRRAGRRRGERRGDPAAQHGRRGFLRLPQARPAAACSGWASRRSTAPATPSIPPHFDIDEGALAIGAKTPGPQRRPPLQVRRGAARREPLQVRHQRAALPRRRDRAQPGRLPDHGPAQRDRRGPGRAAPTSSRARSSPSCCSATWRSTRGFATDVDEVRRDLAGEARCRPRRPRPPRPPALLGRRPTPSRGGRTRRSPRTSATTASSTCSRRPPGDWSPSACTSTSGVDSGDKAIMICDRIMQHLPTLLALSVNSPFWQGRKPGLHSQRVKVMETLPTAGLPPLDAELVRVHLAAEPHGPDRLHQDDPRDLVGRPPPPQLRDGRGADLRHAADAPPRPRPDGLDPVPGLRPLRGDRPRHLSVRLPSVHGPPEQVAGLPLRDGGQAGRSRARYQAIPARRSCIRLVDRLADRGEELGLRRYLRDRPRSRRAADRRGDGSSTIYEETHDLAEVVRRMLALTEPPPRRSDTLLDARARPSPERSAMVWPIIHRSFIDFLTTRHRSIVIRLLR